MTELPHSAENGLQGHDWDCGECGYRITVPDPQNDEHSVVCSLYLSSVTPPAMPGEPTP